MLSRGGCVAQRKHGCFPPSSPPIFFLCTGEFVNSIGIEPIKWISQMQLEVTSRTKHYKKFRFKSRIDTHEKFIEPVPLLNKSHHRAFVFFSRNSAENRKHPDHLFLSTKFFFSIERKTEDVTNIIVWRKAREKNSTKKIGSRKEQLICSVWHLFLSLFVPELEWSLVWAQKSS